MQKVGPILALGFLITAVASCRSSIDNDPAALEPALTMTPEALTGTAISSRPIETAAAQTAGPATSSPELSGDTRQTLGSDRAGLSLAVPQGWINMTGQINTPVMGNRLGINLLFAADSERTGRSLLAGKPFFNGAYVSGLALGVPASSTDPATVLGDILATAAPSAVRLTVIDSITSANGVDGYVVDIADGPVGLSTAEPTDLRTRVALFVPKPSDSVAGPGSWIIVLLSASAARWDQDVETFEQILGSARVFSIPPDAPAQEGNVIVRPELSGDRNQAQATLGRGASDLWTFRSTGGRFASLFVRPEDAQLDLILTLSGPDRQTIAQVDNGYAGVMESVADLALSQPGVYIIEVRNFAGDAGRYTLTLEQGDQPRYNAGGALALSQSLQTRLPADGRQDWVFPGLARQRIDIVIEPRARNFDAILQLAGPDGQLLVELDEGFSGDPEVLSGFELPVAGEYVISVNSFSSQGGPYAISLAEGGPSIANFFDAGDLAYGLVREESLRPDEAHAWFLQAAAGDHILVRVTPLNDNLDLDIWLLNEAIERVAAVDSFAAGDPETIETTLAADGRYIVLVRDFNGQPGDYQIALGAAAAATPETGGTLVYGDTIIDTIDPGAAVVWAFEAEIGDVIDVDVRPGDSYSDLVVQLRGPDGRTVLEVDATPAGADESIAGFIIPSAGLWQIVLSEFFAGMASFQLSVSLEN